MRARLAAHARWAQHDSHEHAAKMRKAGPAGMAWWLDEVDPYRVLDPGDRQRRAEHAKKAHYPRLQFLSAKARRQRGGQRESA